MSDTSTQPEAPARRLRLCQACGQLDDHPRHTIAVGPGIVEAQPHMGMFESTPDGTPAMAIAEQMNPTVVIRHIDCCAAAGCKICQATEAITGGVRGDDLHRAITVDGVLDDFEHPEITDNAHLGLTVAEQAGGTQLGGAGGGGTGG